jgi:L,D-transpeptidase ErfK/SrfK
VVIASRFLRLSIPRMQGPDIMAVQRRLIALGFYSDSDDGIYGPLTQEAVMNFQEQNGILMDGIVGPLTWTALGMEGVTWGGGQYHIAIDTTQNTLTLYDHGQISDTYSVTTGKPSTPTPVGDWVIIEKMPNPGGPFGAAWMRISVPNGGYAVHGTDDPTSIGQSVSHGCVRMQNTDVMVIYNTVPLGTLVTITGQLATTRVLSTESTPGRDVAEIETMLRTLGYYRGPVDGIYSQAVKSSVQKFQDDFNLAADGIIGPQTIVTLQSRYDIALGDVQP